MKEEEEEELEDVPGLCQARVEGAERGRELVEHTRGGWCPALGYVP